MSQTTDRYASLFVAVTGRDTITEARERDDANRLHADDVDADAITDTARHRGLDDAIDDPDVDFD